MVDYAAAFSPLTPTSRSARSACSFPAGAPAAYAPGDTVAVRGVVVADGRRAAAPPGSGQFDTTIAVDVDGIDVGEFPVDNSLANADVLDENGKAAVSFALPTGIAAGAHIVTITGTTTGSTTTVPLQTVAAASTTTLTPEAASQVYGAAATGHAHGDGHRRLEPGDGRGRLHRRRAGAHDRRPGGGRHGDVRAPADHAGRYVHRHRDVCRLARGQSTARARQRSSRSRRRRRRRSSWRPARRSGAARILPTLLISGTSPGQRPAPARATSSSVTATTVVARTGTCVGLSHLRRAAIDRVGTHTFTATFVPFDTANHAPSTSNAVVINVTP